MEYNSTKFDNLVESAYVMVMIHRAHEPLEAYLEPNKVVVIYGPRRVGKTTLLHEYLSNTKWRTLSVVGDDLPTQQLLSSRDVTLIQEYLEGYELFVIDEAQYVPSIGHALKIIVDQPRGIRVIATGSSSFDLSGQLGEPLTGRKRTLTLFPLSQHELLPLHNRFELKQRLEQRLIFGAYPQAITAQTRKARIEVVSEIANSYLLKDILDFDRVRGSRAIWDLLKLLAFQIGSEVSQNELSRSLGIDVKTVGRYLDLLEKSFVLYRLDGFSRNLRKEVTRNSKYFFYDNGIRNAVIAQFNRLDQRDDVGALWENFMVMERIKYLTYIAEAANLYFWRTYSQQEIDLVEERGRRLDGYEFKWSQSKTIKPPPEWARAYPKASFTVITPENYQELVLP
ncbi:MAG: ATP-binding protein [Anaerolineae bacterium]|nr:MAG: ATP-binding protein [Anaerolineae bacterium]